MEGWTAAPDTRDTRIELQTPYAPWRYVECSQGLDTAVSLADWRASVRPTAKRRRFLGLI